jgi:type II secretory ATPase GspE/PulE/Tfp pilus assembly ATPase PilB-like protein
MVGEIRDKLTAEAAATASDTGHLVLTTVHANSALSVFRRLESLGVKPQRIVENIRMVMGQRLYLPLCPHCRLLRSPSDIERNILRIARAALTTLFPDVKEIEEVSERKRTGCAHCSYTGYAKRRQAAIEIAVFDDEMRDMVLKGHTLLDLEKAFVGKRGFIPLSKKAYNLLYEGSIDLNQYYQITNIR